ncbi:MAG: hypothetical protein JWM14_3274 [Chitinophagaceae bacterium]|nr:hypothetical protein [Chitinophagaceae bacterium]
MQTKLNETVLAQCSLRYVKGEADKMYECYITPTKLYFSRKGNVEVTSLQNISNVSLTQRLNWLLLILGISIIGVALINYKYGVFPEKDARLTTTQTTPVNPSSTNGLTPPEELFKDGNQKLTPPEELFKDGDQQLTPPDQLFADDDRMALQVEWEKSKNYISFGIAIFGAICLYFGFKKTAYLKIVTNTETILLRVFTITDQFNAFYHALLSRVGLTNNSK